nr:MAG TPA: excisionase [Caudoviricetes sp.]
MSFRREEITVEEIKKSLENGKMVVPISEKYMLTIKEASVYFNIGIKKLRRMAEDNTGRFAVYSGNRYLIIRTKFEKFIEESSAI